MIDFFATFFGAPAFVVDDFVGVFDAPDFLAGAFFEFAFVGDAFFVAFLAAAAGFAVADAFLVTFVAAGAVFELFFALVAFAGF